MSAPYINSSQALEDEILAAARRTCEDIGQREQQEAEAILARASAEAGQLRQERLSKAQTEAARRKDLILATVSVEVVRLGAIHVEALLESVLAESRRRLQTRAGFDARETCIALAVEAISRMTGNAFIVKLSPADHAGFGAGLADAIIRRVKQPSLQLAISSEPEITCGGVMVQDAAGYQAWDNRLEARLERLWPEMRRQIAVQSGLVAASESTRGSV